MSRLFAAPVLFAFASVAGAQSLTPYLQGVYPAGCKAGGTAKLSLRGGNLEGVTALYFSHPGIKAELTGGSATVATVEPDPKAKVAKRVGAPAAGVSGQVWTVTVAADVPTGLHEVRVVSRNGISNARAFIVSSLNEVMENDGYDGVKPAEAVAKAQVVELDTVVNGQAAKVADVDWYRLKLTKGRRTVIQCSAEYIDSKMSPSLQLFDPAGKPLLAGAHYAGGTREALLDFTPPADGEYLLKLWDFVYQGGPVDYYYRLSVSTQPQIEFTLPNAVQAGKTAEVTVYGRNLPGGKPAGEAVVNGQALEKTVVSITAPDVSDRLNVGLWMRPSGITIRGFEYRIKGSAGWSAPVMLAAVSDPVVLEQEDNNLPEKAQVVAVPCEIVGQFGTGGDIDSYRFEAKRGEVFRIEVISSRLGTVGDPEIYIGRYDTKTEAGKTNETWTYLQEQVDDDTTAFGAVAKNQSGKFDVRSYDPRTVWTAPADGKYFVRIKDLTGAGRGDCRFVYRLSIRRAEPDFRLAVMHTEDVRADALTVRRGGHQAYQLLCGRYDGFDGMIKVEVQGLPPGVSCPATYLGPGVNQVALIVHAEEKAAPWAGPIRVIGTATVGGKTVTREAVGAMLVQEGGQQGQGQQTARITRDVVLAVADDVAPFTLTTEPRDTAVAPGGKVDVKVKVARRAGFDDAVTLLNFDTAQMPVQGQQTKAQATIAKGKDDAVISITAPRTNGRYTYAVLGQGTAQLSTNPGDPKAARKATKVSEPSNAVTVTVGLPFEIKSPGTAPKLTVGGTIEIPVTITRSAGVKEAVRIDIPVPQGRGLTVEPAVIAAGATEGKVRVKADAKAVTGAVSGLNLTGVITVDGSPLTVSGPAITIDVAATAPPPDVKAGSGKDAPPSKDVKTPPKQDAKTEPKDAVKKDK